MEEFVTACPRNCYSTCSFRVQVENNKIIRILPYEANRATPEGPCIKGLSYIERTHSSERIITPLLKSSTGNFHAVTPEVAFEFIGHELDRIRQKYGSHSLLWYRGSGMSGITNEIGYHFWKAFGGVTTTYGNLCWPAGLEAVRLTLGSVKHNVPWDLQNANTLIIWGKNPAETNIHEIAFIAAARRKGCKVVVIDPLRTPTADKADILFCPVPGTDAALALAVAKILIEEDLVDNHFINRYVKGFEEFRKSLTLTPTEAEKITGIPEENILELAKIIAEGKPLTIIPGYGLQRHQNGGQTIRSILSLIILTGNIGKPGTGFNYANLQSYIYDSLKEPLSYYPDPENDMPFRRTISMTKLGHDMLNTDPELKAIWVERGNPILQSPDSQNIKKAFKKLQLKVVVDQFMTDTAAEADIILPAKDLFEQSDIIGSYWSPYVQFKPKVLDPPGEVIPETEIYYHLAKKLHLQIDKTLIPEPGNENIEIWLNERIKGYPDVTMADLKKGPLLPPGLQEIAWEDLKFETPSGKIELYSEEANVRWKVSQLPEYVPLNTCPGHDHFPLLFLTPNTGSRIHSQFGNLKFIKDVVRKTSTSISPTDAAIRGISGGQKIRIFNGNGEITSIAEISNRVPQGIIVLPNGIGKDEGGGGNILISGMETDMGYGAAFHDNMIEMEGMDNE